MIQYSKCFVERMIIIKTIIKKGLVFTLLGLCIFNIAGCGAPSVKPLQIEDIKWFVEDDVIWDEQAISFNYTNNSSYIITDVELELKLKDDVTSEQLEVFRETEEDSLEDLSDVWILGYNRKFADPGETVKHSPCVFNGTYKLVTTTEQFNLMEPKEITLSYISSDNKQHTFYYDYETKSATSHDSDEEIYQWTKNDLSKSIAIPKAKVMTVDEDEINVYWFTAYEYTREMYESYANECKKAGFTDDFSVGDTLCYGINADGYKLQIYFDELEEKICGRVEIKE